MRAAVWRIGTVFVVWLALAGTAAAQAGATSERVVVDPITGLAVAGYDPVEYMLARRPVMGEAEHEATWDGAVWRFRNAGNRAAFLAHPQIYAPRFGGHDPVAMARGFVARGDPYLFAVAGDRLYLFHTEDNLRLFAAGPDAFVPQAERNWPRLASQLAR